MVSEYEIAKAAKIITDCVQEANSCLTCRLKPYCEQGYDQNICWGLSRKIKKWYESDWEEWLESCSREVSENEI